MVRTAFLLLAGLVLLGACSHAGKRANLDGNLAALTAPQFFAAVEERLLGASPLSVRYVIHSKGSSTRTSPARSISARMEALP